MSKAAARFGNSWRILLAFVAFCFVIMLLIVWWWSQGPIVLLYADTSIYLNRTSDIQVIHPTTTTMSPKSISTTSTTTTTYSPTRPPSTTTKLPTNAPSTATTIRETSTHTSDTTTSTTTTTPYTTTRTLAPPINNQTCNLYLVKNRSPHLSLYHFYHDFECIISALRNRPDPRPKLEDCEHLNMIVPAKYNYSRSAYRHIDVFNFTVIDDETFAASPYTHYGCHQSQNYFYELRMFRKFIIKRFAFDNIYGMGYDSADFFAEYGDILIVNRAHHRRIFNAQELYQSLSALYAATKHSVRMVYFEGMSVIEQYHCILNSSVIITPHGAAETNLVMVNADMKKSIKIIEICPTYTHCSLDGKRPLCPFFYGNAWKSLVIHAIAREDNTLGNCSMFMDHHSHNSRQVMSDLKRVITFEVPVEQILHILQNGSEIQAGPVHIGRADFSKKEFEFYNSSQQMVNRQNGEFFNLYA